MGAGGKCGGCSLESLGSGFTQVEVGSRYQQTRLLVIAEASGENEAREGLPLRPHAQSGSLFADALREMNISRADIAITNVCRCRPPKDFWEGAPWQFSASQHCVTNYLADVVKELQPRAILALGGTAFRTLVDAPKGRQGTLDYIRGYAMPGAGVAEGVPVVPTYHPAYLRRGASHLTPLLQRDLRRAFLIATGKLRDGEQIYLDPLAYAGKMKFQPAPTIDEAWEWYRGVDAERSIYADLETPRSTREDEDERNSFADRDINLAQFTQRRGEGIALPFRDEYVDVIKAILALPNRKVGHNWFGFDLPVLAANGIVVNGEQDDTMLQFHYWQPDLPANLQAAAQFCGYPVAWKHLSDVDNALYGVMDVDATCWVDETMTTLLRREGMWEAYQRYFAKFWPILRDMAQRGIPIDDSRRLELRETIKGDDERADVKIRALVPEEVLGQKQKNGLKNPPILVCEDCGFKGRGDHICQASDISIGEDSTNISLSGGQVMPYSVLAEANGLVLREVTLKEDEKCRCTSKTRNACDVCKGSGIIHAGVVEWRWAALTEFNPNSSLQVKRFMRYLKHPVPKHAKRVDALTGSASETTEVKELERLYAKTKHPIYPLLIEKRQLSKIMGTYVEGWQPGRDGRIHTTFTLKPATWQTSSRAPNVQNGLKHGRDAAQKQRAKSFNGMQRAEPGHVMVNFDLKSFHAQTTACEAGLPDYLRLAKIDIHSFVTCHYLKLPERVGLYERPDEEMKDLFKQLKKGEKFKFCRDYKAKRTILGIQFAMGPRKLFTLNPDDFDSITEATVIHTLIMQDLFPGLGKWQRAVKDEAIERKMLDNKFGAIRRFYDVARWDRKTQRMAPGDQAEAAIAFRPASNAFGAVRDMMHAIRDEGWDERYQLVNTIHDSLVFHCPEGLVDECVANIRGVMEAPSKVLVYAKVAPGGLSVEAEALVGEDLAEMEEWKN